MFKRLSRFFLKNTKISLVVIPLVAIIFLFILLPTFEEFLNIDTSHVSLDKPMLYSASEINSILTDWGEEGRKSQFLLHITWDLLLPLFYFFFLGFLLSLLLRNVYEKGSRVHYLNLVSLVAVIDILENISLFILITLYPNTPTLVCWIKTSLTLIKYYIFGPGIVIALIVGISGLFKKEE